MTQEDLARSARVGVRTLRDLETGRAERPQRSTIDLLADALGLDGPARLAFAAAARAGRRGSPHPALPPPASLAGRDRAIREIADLIADVTPLTLVGIAGVGKSVLAQAACHRAAPRFASAGIVVVTETATTAELLAAMDAVGAMVTAPLATAAVPASGPGGATGTAASSAGPVLVLLDGADRSPQASREALQGFASRMASGSRIVVTSRYPLGVAGEHARPVPPLDLPPPAATEREVFNYAATVLFVDRLARVRPRPVGLDEAATVKALVRRLGGVPRALELAASRGRVLQLEQMLARCGHPGPDTDPACVFLRDAVAASWGTLNPVDRTCLSMLATFEGFWSIELAEAILAAPAQVPGVDAVAVVDRLVGVGLVNVVAEADDLRFWLIETVRGVALEHAGRVGALAAVRDRHARVMAGLVADAVAQRSQVHPPGLLAARLDDLAGDVAAGLKHLRQRDPDAAVRLESNLATLRHPRPGRVHRSGRGPLAEMTGRRRPS